MGKLQVVKIGSECAISNRVEYGRITDVCYSITRMKYEEEVDTIVVASGAIRFGLLDEIKKGLRSPEELKNRPLDAKELQSLARLGQTHLMNFYAECFQRANDRYMVDFNRPNSIAITPTQVLATYHNLELKDEKPNTMEGILRDARERYRVPLFNYNDGVDCSEVIRDNDKPAAEIAVAVNADWLIMLGVVGGLLDADGKVIPEIREITADIEVLCEKTSSNGTGGPKARLEAARILRASPKLIPLYWSSIDKGLEGALNGEGTVFVPLNTNI